MEATQERTRTDADLLAQAEAIRAELLAKAEREDRGDDWRDRAALLRMAQFAINGRLTRTLGRATMVGAKAGLIELSRQQLRLAENREAAEVVIRHELAHVIDIPNRSRPRWSAHGRSWKACARCTGAPPQAGTRLVVSCRERTRQDRHRIRVTCDLCGRETEHTVAASTHTKLVRGSADGSRHTRCCSAPYAIERL